MSAILLDTSVASLLHPKRRGSPLRARYEPLLRGRVAALSFQTVAELWAWAEQRRWSQVQRTGLEAFFGRFALLPHTDELNRTWAFVMTEARRAGRRLEAGDGWIAASAVHYGVWWERPHAVRPLPRHRVHRRPARPQALHRVPRRRERWMRGVQHDGAASVPDVQRGGKIEAWLEVAIRRFDEVVVMPPDSAAAGVHRRIRSPDDFDAGQWVNPLLADTGEGTPPPDLAYRLGDRPAQRRGRPGGTELRRQRARATGSRLPARPRARRRRWGFRSGPGSSFARELRPEALARGGAPA